MRTRTPVARERVAQWRAAEMLAARDLGIESWLRRFRPVFGRKAYGPEGWRRLVAEGVSEGRRNDAIARLAGHLLRRRIDPYVAL